MDDPGARRPEGMGGRWHDPAVEGISGLCALHGRSFFAMAHLLSVYGEDRPDAFALPDVMWTLRRVARLTTGDLVARLAALGIHTSLEGFVAATRPGGSAVAYAEEAWLPLLAAASDVHTRDFARLAAIELWKRWRPDDASQESILELYYLTLDAAEKADAAGVVRHGVRLWGQLRPLLTPSMRTLADAQRLWGDPHEWDMKRWVTDFSAGADDAAPHDHEAGRRAAAVLADLLEQFTDAPEQWKLNVAQDRADLLYVTGAREQGERILLDQIAAHPDKAAAYVILAGLWAPKGENDKDAIRKALALLEEANQRPLVDARFWEPERRMNELRDRLAAGG